MADDRHSRYSSSRDLGYRWVSNRTDVMNNNSDNRDELAALAMSAIVIGRIDLEKETCNRIAVIAYRMADAMIACKKGRIPSE